MADPDSSLGYDAIPYRGQPIPATAPAALALASACFGGPRLALDAPLRVLEVGCGDATNLLALAFFHPGWRFVGVDASGGAIARGRKAAAALGLSNLRLEARALADFATDFADAPASDPADDPASDPAAPFDVIVAHGLYSWVGPEDRAALRRLVAEALAPGGLVYVGFNALPGWGVRGRVRDALLRAGVGGVAEARARLDDWRATLGEPGHPWAALLAEELERARAAPDDYLAHEYLAPHNQPFWLGDVVRDFEAQGLRYLGDADFTTTGWVDPALRAQLDTRVGHGAPDAPASSAASPSEIRDDPGCRAQVHSNPGGRDAFRRPGRRPRVHPDPVAREEQIDLLLCRQHRAALFARERGESVGRTLLDEAYLATAVRRRHDPFDVSPGVEEPFDGNRGHELRVRSALTKVALLLLADRYPEGLPLATVLERSRALLARDRIRPEPGDEAKLRDALWALFERSELELRLEAPPLRTEPGPRPEAPALTRWEARHGVVLTTPLHTALPLEPVDREIVARLDGTRTVAELVAALADAVEVGALTLEGPPSGGARLRPLLEARVRRTLTLLGWWGLAT